MKDESVLAATAAHMRIRAGGRGVAAGSGQAVPLSIPGGRLVRAAGRTKDAAGFLLRDGGFFIEIMATGRTGQIVKGHVKISLS